MSSSNHTQPALLVFADDWGRHPSSCQHLIRHLLPRYPVFWVNTIGTRRPGLNLSSFTRGWEKLKHWARAESNGHGTWENLHVLNPRMWPYFSRSWDRKLNRELLARQLMRVLRTVRGPVVGVTTLPITSDLIGSLPVARWVYYCVDDFTAWPGLDQVALREMERRLVRESDEVIAVSETLQSRIAGMGRTARLLTHGIDLDHWSVGEPQPSLRQLASFDRPLVVFWGVIDRRMDVEFLKRLGADLERGTILLVGPELDADPRIHDIPQVRRVAPLPYADLPRLAAEASVLIMPYADLPVTRAIQPLKLKEYLATGRPTVVRDLPATREWSSCLDLADSAESFSSQVRLRIASGLPAVQAAGRTALAGENWSDKARLFETWAIPPHDA